MNIPLATLTPEERKQRLIWLLALLAIAGMTFLQRNQRSLIIDGGGMPTASAFAAIAPPPPSVAGLSPKIAQLLGGRPANGRSRPSAFFAQGTPQDPTASPGSATGAPSAPQPAPATSPSGSQLSPSVLAAQTAGPNVGSNGGASGPAGPQLTGAAASVGPAVGAVPEPSTWMMMIMGLCGIGFLLRRQGQLARTRANPST